MKLELNEPIVIPPERLPEEVLKMPIAALQRKTGLHRMTIQRIRSGQACRESTYSELLKPFGYTVSELTENLIELPTFTPIRLNDEWEAIDRPSPVKTAQNGLQYSIYHLKHRHLVDHFGRGKRYDIAHCGIEERRDWLPKLQRHGQSCLRIRSPRLPHHLGFFRTDQTSTVWWVVDAWNPGRMLSEIISNEDPIEYIPSIAIQIAEGLMAMHAEGVIRRDLSPDSILIHQQQVTLTDFELAKLGQGMPTVSTTRLTNPYVAPEVADGDAKPQADLFSWARVVSHVILGELTPLAQTRTALADRSLPMDVRQILLACLEILPSKRPTSLAAILPRIQPWAQIS